MENKEIFKQDYPRVTQSFFFLRLLVVDESGFGQ
jgi:hypothetical protein